MKPSLKPIFVKLRVDLFSLMKQSVQMRWHRLVFWLIRLKRRGLQQRSVPVLRPHAIGIARTGRPGEHRIGEIHAERITQKPEQPPRVLEDVSSIDYGRDRPGSPVHPIEDLELLWITGIFELRGPRHLDERCYDLAR